MFLLFLDCVWQLLQQFPAEFEFSEFFLLALHDSVRVPDTLTFLRDNSWERGKQSGQVSDFHFSLVFHIPPPPIEKYFLKFSLVYEK